MAKMVYDESYGELTFAQRTAYRKYNVSPSDHRELVDEFGDSAHAAITQYVKDNSTTGMYRHAPRSYTRW
jgi:hypothetical protein